jgi:hypothetical protein
MQVYAAPARRVRSTTTKMRQLPVSPVWLAPISQQDVGALVRVLPAPLEASITIATQARLAAVAVALLDISSLYAGSLECVRSTCALQAPVTPTATRRRLASPVTLACMLLPSPADPAKRCAALLAQQITTVEAPHLASPALSNLAPLRMPVPPALAHPVLQVPVTMTSMPARLVSLVHPEALRRHAPLARAPCIAAPWTR